METSREIWYKEEERRTQRIGVLGSLLASGLIFLFLTFFALYPPDPPPPDTGMEIAFGLPDAGQYSPDEGTPQEQSSASQSPTQDLTQDFENAPTTPTNSNNTQSTEPNPNQTQNRPNINLPTFGKPGGTPNDGTKPGTPGLPDGGGTNLTGSVGGGLGNRKTTSRPEGHSTCEQKGFIQIRIEVDPQGRVVKAEYQASGSTIATTVCKNDAVAQAKLWRFESDPNATKNAVGVLTIEFK